jgi:ketosteroid isomerase-like protein
MYASFFPQFSSVEQTVSMEEIQVTGDWAFTRGGERFVLVPWTGGPPIQMEGKGMSILRRQPGASWRFARGINNTLPRSAP